MLKIMLELDHPLAPKWTSWIG